MWEGFRGLGKEGKQKKWEGGIKKVWREASGNNVEEAKKRGSGRTRKRVAEMKGEKKGRIRLVDYARIIIIYHGLTVLNPLKKHLHFRLGIFIAYGSIWHNVLVHAILLDIHVARNNGFRVRSKGRYIRCRG